MENITYEEFIDNILITRGRNGCGDTYHETHHILPKCCGGDDNNDNLIDLYAAEHFIAHKLLALENPENKKLVYAWWNMCQCKGSSKKRIDVTPEEYELARIAFCKNISESQMGENNSFYGKRHSEETRKILSEMNRGENNSNYGKHLSDEIKKKISVANTGRIISDETRKKLSQTQSGENNGMYGKHHSEESRMKMSHTRQEMYNGEKNPMYGKHHSENTKEKIRQARLGKKDSDETRKKKSESKLGGKHYASRAVFCIELNRYFGGISEAARETGVQQASISRCCKGEYGFAGKYPVTGEKLHWVYADEMNNSHVA